ncbi:ribonuclease P protein component [Nocardioides sp. SYSU D00038]|uniref:ribonuclease P protein component n=1 Tax=Nocardioides sp. SYSU D00038 TaxID=2812554 RepID=UPI001966E786|nr:ribonuclease P protein component [Nocardioides sp. SYSU D00038]
MLAAEHRLTSGAAFGAAVRAGRRSGSRTLVVHLAGADVPAPPRVGFVVSKAVGNAVVRNRVKRRLRHLVAARLGLLPAGSVLVVRANPAAAGASGAELGSELDRCLDRVLA